MNRSKHCISITTVHDKDTDTSWYIDKRSLKKLNYFKK